MRKITIASLAAAVATVAGAQAVRSLTSIPTGGLFSDKLTVSAERVAADRKTGALLATGGVVAVSAPARLYADALERDTNGVCRMLGNSTMTTCTNHVDELHWSIHGEIEYQAGDHVLLRNAKLYLFRVPVFWLPYLYYPTGGKFGIEMMPGYTGRWGAYLLTRVHYDMFGDRCHDSEGLWLSGATRFDLRYKNGIAIGEHLDWSLGQLGKGRLGIYYAWDQDADDRYGVHRAFGDDYNFANWGSNVPENRYGITFEHRVDLTERDIVRARGAIYSDTYFNHDFNRRTLFGRATDIYGFQGNEIAWEHGENLWGAGISVSGPLNEFYSGTSRLPEVYVDVAPMPVWKLPVNYESQNRIGYLGRQPAEYDGATIDAFRYNPGRWADYDAFRFDTYHRLTAPFKLWDALSVVPRIAYRGTFWDETGNTVLDGCGTAGENRDNALRSILEGGITFAGRGSAWIAEEWQHMMEPYVDVLAQEAFYSGLGSGRRPYVFDNLDASVDWADQFAGRSRNLPYSWYGITPGYRNAFRRADERGRLRTVFDLDVYAALQFNSTTHTAGDDSTRLTKDPEKPNYGRRDTIVVPGARARWMPFDAAAFCGRIEYDSEYNKIAMASLTWSHVLSRRFKYNLSYMSRDHRWWDYSSTPVTEGQFDGFNWCDFSCFEIEFEHEVCDAFAWAPFLRWDCRVGELDEVGAWFDVYRTDCLGFRFNVAYENEYTRTDGSVEDEDWRVGFCIYLRAFGTSGIGIGD